MASGAPAEAVPRGRAVQDGGGHPFVPRPCLPVNWALRTCGLWMMSFQSCSNSGILATFCSSRTRSRPIMKQSMNWGKEMEKKNLIDCLPAPEQGGEGTGGQEEGKGRNSQSFNLTAGSR